MSKIDETGNGEATGLHLRLCSIVRRLLVEGHVHSLPSQLLDHEHQSAKPIT